MTETSSSFRFPYEALATSFLWAISPIFIRLGLGHLASPIWGVAIGLTINAIAYGVLLLVRRDIWRGKPLPMATLRWQIAAAVFIGFGTWFRWIALETVPVAILSSIERLSVPIVIVLSIFMLDQVHERVNWRVWAGGGLIVGGAVILTVFR